MGTRNIVQAAYDLIDDRLNYPFAQQCISSGNARLLFAEAVKSLVGVVESEEDEGPEVDLFLATFGLSKNHWCMAFQQTCIAYVEQRLGVSSPLYASAGVLSVWNKSDNELRVQKQPLIGAIACFKHMNGTGTGHTGMVVDCDGEILHTIEGNKSEEKGANVGGKPMINIDGVRMVTRAYDFESTQTGTSDLVLLGCLRPFEFLSS